MRDFLLPDLGEGLEEAEVVTWHVQVGDQVSIDQIVVEVETAKALVEVPVPFAGVVAALHARPGGCVKVGQPLISVTDARRATDTDQPEMPGLQEPGVVTPDSRATARGPGPGDTLQPCPDDHEAGTRSGNVLIGYGTPAEPSRRRRVRRPVPNAPGPTRAESNFPAHGLTAEGGATASRTAARAVRVISPLVRTMARDAGIDLANVTGTGPSGLIRRHDVEREIHSRANTRPAADSEAGAVDEVGHARTPGVTIAGTFTDAGPIGSVPATRIPLRGMRRTIAEKMTRSRREIPEATVWVDVDVTDLLAARDALNAGAPRTPVSLLALMGRFTVLALRRYPVLNGHLSGDEIVIPSHVHLGFAAQTERGLVVPVVHNAHSLTTRDLAAAFTVRTEAARAGRLAPGDLTGGTVTVNNYGVFGVDGSAAIINHPEVAIVGIGRIIDRPWVIAGELAVRKISQLTLAFDHRVCDGGVAGGFLRYLADFVEQPVSALGDL